MSDLGSNVATVMTIFYSKSDIYYLEKIKYDSCIFPHFRVRVS